jgi:uncharacterized protein YdcH (DUF465 family)
MGSIPRENLSAQLMETSEEYRKLAEQHSNYNRRIEELSSQRFPTQEEQVEEMRLKKLKLHLKDKMYDLVRQHQQESG